jgi:hypothetical protein
MEKMSLFEGMLNGVDLTTGQQQQQQQQHQHQHQHHMDGFSDDGMVGQSKRRNSGRVGGRGEEIALMGLAMGLNGNGVEGNGSASGSVGSMSSMNGSRSGSMSGIGPWDHQQQQAFQELDHSNANFLSQSSLSHQSASVCLFYSLSLSLSLFSCFTAYFFSSLSHLFFIVNGLTFFTYYS